MTTNKHPLYQAVMEHLDDDQLREVAEYGADKGWPGFTTYTDTCSFFHDHQALIVALVKEIAGEEIAGEDPISFVASFRCLDDDPDTRDEIGRCIYGAPLPSDISVPNALAWFALEDVARSLD